MREAAAGRAAVGRGREHGADEQDEPVRIPVVAADGLAGQLGEIAADLADLGRVRMRNPSAPSTTVSNVDAAGARRA